MPRRLAVVLGAMLLMVAAVATASTGRIRFGVAASPVGSPLPAIEIILDALPAAIDVEVLGAAEVTDLPAQGTAMRLERIVLAPGETLVDESDGPELLVLVRGRVTVEDAGGRGTLAEGGQFPVAAGRWLLAPRGRRRRRGAALSPRRGRGRDAGGGGGARNPGCRRGFPPFHPAGNALHRPRDRAGRGVARPPGARGTGRRFGRVWRDHGRTRRRVGRSARRRRSHAAGLRRLHRRQPRHGAGGAPRCRVAGAGPRRRGGAARDGDAIGDGDARRR